jgi:hypothetical protein
MRASRNWNTRALVLSSPHPYIAKSYGRQTEAVLRSRSDAMGAEFSTRSDSRAMNSAMTRHVLYNLWIFNEMTQFIFCLCPKLVKQI